jgi:hypothetical protein
MKARGEMSKWRWVLFGAFFVLFPIVFRPWWLALVSFAVFCLLMMLLYPGKSHSDQRRRSGNAVTGEVE